MYFRYSIQRQDHLLKICFVQIFRPREGTNSVRLFTPGEAKALAKSKVHQWSRACSVPHQRSFGGWSSSLISKIWLSEAYIWKITFHTMSFEAVFVWTLKKLEELFYCGKSWNIGQVCFECLMFMNFVALIYCV
jgi:hypothetical protein